MSTWHVDPPGGRRAMRLGQGTTGRLTEARWLTVIIETARCDRVKPRLRASQVSRAGGIGRVDRTT
jgi:hypothetical protein